MTRHNAGAGLRERMVDLISHARPERRIRCGAALSVLIALVAPAAVAQTVDCARLQQQISQGERGGNRGAQAARRQAGELARTQAYAHQLGCDGFTLFGGNPQCGALNGRIAQLQANLQQLQAAGGSGGRGDLIARFNAYCRGGAAPPPQRGFFDSLLGALTPQAPPPPPTAVLPQVRDDDRDDEGPRGRGGSQAVCVRGCDGGFFPLPISARHGADDLTQMCEALCPGAETAVFTRNPDSDIKTSVGLDGKPYTDLPNALAFQKRYTAACSCRPAGKSWAETLATAEEVLDNTRKGDIVVTPEKAAELSRPKGGPMPGVPPVRSAPPQRTAGDGTITNGDPTIKRPVRQVGPQP